MGVRVIRTMEYHYPDLESYLKDSQRWTMQSPNTWVDGNMQMRTIGVLVSADDGPWAEHTEAVDMMPDIRKAMREIAADEWDRQGLIAQIKAGLDD